MCMLKALSSSAVLAGAVHGHEAVLLQIRIYIRDWTAIQG